MDHRGDPGFDKPVHKITWLRADDNWGELFAVQIGDNVDQGSRTPPLTGTPAVHQHHPYRSTHNHSTAIADVSPGDRPSCEGFHVDVPTALSSVRHQPLPACPTTASAGTERRKYAARGQSPTGQPRPTAALGSTRPRRCNS